MKFATYPRIDKNSGDVATTTLLIQIFAELLNDWFEARISNESPVAKEKDDAKGKRDTNLEEKKHLCRRRSRQKNYGGKWAM